MFLKNWNVKAILQHWLLIAIVVTGIIGLLYAAVQQDLRQGANDPQIQMAEDAAAKLADGQSAQYAVVVTQFKGSNSGFVLAGRSLREVEKREDGIVLVLLTGWVIMILVTFVATAVLCRKNSAS